jgi:hypothetical protein
MVFAGNLKGHLFADSHTAADEDDETILIEFDGLFLFEYPTENMG